MLIRREFVRAMLTYRADWAYSHAAHDGYLGMGLIYYSLVYIKKARIAVCLGSGGGFVPRLMRQAQRDVGIADCSRTILIDANLPEAGWGSPQWLDENSFFRRRFGDVELLLSTTEEASENFFSQQGLTIDLLHIDADHSFVGCLDDYWRYARFLGPSSLVTFHDTSSASAGVRAVIEYLRGRTDCDVIDFPDIGCGTAIVRFTGQAERPAAALATERRASKNLAVIVERRPDAPTAAPPDMGWKYLESDAFAVRSILAANYLRDCPMVIEIGGGKPTIDNFLTAHHHIVVVGPGIHDRKVAVPEGDGYTFRHIRARFQDLEWEIKRPGEYGLVMLGLELHGLSDDNWRTLFALINGARATVIEFSTSFAPSCQQFTKICRNTTTREQFACKLDLSGNDVGDLINSWPPRFDRELHVLVQQVGE